MINIDELRALNGKVTYNPLGVVKLRLNYDEFWHFYSDKTPVVLNVNIHSHPYSYESKILKGSLRHHIHSVEETDEETSRNFQVRGRSNKSPMVIKYENINVKEVVTFDTHVDSSYYIRHSVLHQTELLTEKCVTYLKAEPWQKQVFFVMDKDKTYTREDLFQRATTAECWEIIEHTLNEDNS
jgi:hypothetical protein